MSSRGGHYPDPRTRSGYGDNYYPPGLPGGAATPRSSATSGGGYFPPQSSGGPSYEPFYASAKSVPYPPDPALSSRGAPPPLVRTTSAVRTSRSNSQGIPGQAPSGYDSGMAPYQDRNSFYGYSNGPAPSAAGYGPAMGQENNRYSNPGQQNWEQGMRVSPDRYPADQDISSSPTSSDYLGDPPSGQQQKMKVQVKLHAQRRPSNRDEFDGPHQLLDRPPPEVVAAQERDLPHLPTNLYVQEQDDVLAQVNDRLSQCAFDFVAKYQFPIPLESDKRPVRVPADREWTEWVYLLKRLATKRRIPARVLYNGQIKQLVTVLENSLEMRHAAKHQSRPLKDDRNVLQLISAGIQVTKMLKDASAMEFLDHLYVRTEKLIQSRRSLNGF
ncbi:MAG: hypothetical protein M1819_006292 [Sarea resinae]|nr:MAG: hypothetical protein M1819_006292 [Sarea resinae]